MMVTEAVEAASLDAARWFDDNPAWEGMRRRWRDVHVIILFCACLLMEYARQHQEQPHKWFIASNLWMRAVTWWVRRAYWADPHTDPFHIAYLELQNSSLAAEHSQVIWHGGALSVVASLRPWCVHYLVPPGCEQIPMHTLGLTFHIYIGHPSKIHIGLPPPYRPPTSDNIGGHVRLSPVSERRPSL